MLSAILHTVSTFAKAFPTFQFFAMVFLALHDTKRRWRVDATRMRYNTMNEKDSSGTVAKMAASHTATLSNQGRYTTFRFRDTLLRFIAPEPLERYVEVNEWDRGYLVVMAKYSLCDEPIEEYIDLVPVLENLYMDPDEFCAPIEKVEVAHA